MFNIANFSITDHRSNTGATTTSTASASSATPTAAPSPANNPATTTRPEQMLRARRHIHVHRVVTAQPDETGCPNITIRFTSRSRITSATFAPMRPPRKEPSIDMSS